MTRETRLNLIFLTVFTLVSLPGAVILFYKKLDPASPRMDAPDAVNNRLPYMTPPPAPPEMKWIVPDGVRSWLPELAGGPVLSATPAGPDWEPVISADHAVQILRLRDTPTGTEISLLFWRAQTDPTKPPANSISLRMDDSAETLHVIDARSVPIPSDVRHELVRLGYERPPTDVLRVVALAPRLAPESSHHLAYRYDGPEPCDGVIEFTARFPSAGNAHD